MSPRPVRRFLRLPWRSRARLRADVDDELRFYFDMRARELVDAGWSEDAARREAVREFGDVDFTRRYCIDEDIAITRDERRTAFLSELRQDAAHAWRGLRRAPGFAAVALLTLALGIGANTAIFSVVRGALLRALPYRDGDRVVRIYTAYADGSNTKGQTAAADYMDYRERQRSFEDLAAFAFGSYTHVGEGDPTQIQGARVTANVFQLLGTPAALGRTLRPGEDGPGSPQVVVLGDAPWRRVFGADPTIVGRAIQLNGISRTVVGVMPPGFMLPGVADAELWVPIDLSGLLADVNRARKFRFLGMLGRMRPGVTIERAQADLAAIAARLEADHPESNTGFLPNTVPVREAMVGKVRPALLVLMGASALVLLIACANVAGVLLSRSVARRQEFAIRAALGAGRGRLIRQMLTESVLVASLGGALGLALAFWGTAALVRIAAEPLRGAGPIGIDRGVLLFTLATTIVCGLLFGLLPAITGSRDVHESLKDASRGSSSGAGRHRLRSALVAGQMALAVVLLIGAGLLVQSLAHLQRSELGYATSGLLTFDILLPGARYESNAREDQFFDQLHERLRTVPGVLSTATVGSLPLHGGSSASLAIEGRPMSDAKLPEVGYVPVSDDYFRALRIPLLRGRAFGPIDRDSTPGVVIVSEGLAKTYWPGADPTGARVRLGPDPSEPWNTVVGVVADVRQGVSGDPRPTVYVSSRQDHWRGAAVIVRTNGEPLSLVPAVRRELRAIDPALPVIEPRSMDEVLDGVLADRRLPMQLMLAFALLALALAAVGVYGVMAYSVAARAREFGIRLALGARPSGVLSLVVRQGMLTAVIGLVVGLAGAAALARLIAGLLYGVRPLDPLTFASVPLLLLGVSLVACMIPARRATRVDPVMALRSD